MHSSNVAWLLLSLSACSGGTVADGLAAPPPSDAGTSTPVDGALPQSGDGTPQKNDAEANACKLPLSNASACFACVNASCCELTALCLANPDCMAIFTCATGCRQGGDGGKGGDLPRDSGGVADAGDGGVRACLDACMAQRPAGAAQAMGVLTCVEASCATTCSL
jgi:hypothetical protein